MALANIIFFFGGIVIIFIKFCIWSQAPLNFVKDLEMSRYFWFKVHLAIKQTNIELKITSAVWNETLYV